MARVHYLTKLHVHQLMVARLFIGTALDPGTSTQLQASSKADLHHPRWSSAPLDQWHVTSYFIGNRPSSTIPYIAERIARIASATAPIELVNGRITTMPKHEPYMLWTRFRPNSLFTRLHHALAQAVGGAPSVHVPYWPHITLARTNRISAPNVNGDVVLHTLRIDHITLFRSEPSSTGTVHKALESWALTGTGPVARSEGS